jgi:hypothetical protein
MKCVALLWWGAEGGRMEFEAVLTYDRGPREVLREEHVLLLLCIRHLRLSIV